MFSFAKVKYLRSGGKAHIQPGNKEAFMMGKVREMGKGRALGLRERFKSAQAVVQS